MLFRGFAFIVIGLTTVLGSPAPAADVTPDVTALKEVDGRFFTFKLPANMTKSDAKGIDSHVGQYAAPGIEVGFDYGAYSDPLAYDRGLPGFRDSRAKVDGRKARIVTFQQEDTWFTAIHFPDVGAASGDVKLTVSAHCKTEREVAIAERIFRSVSFR